MKTFKDWEGHRIPYRMSVVEGEHRCALDAHNTDEWLTFGRGPSKAAALREAAETWKRFREGEPVEIGDSKPEDNLLEFTVGGEAREEN